MIGRSILAAALACAATAMAQAGGSPRPVDAVIVSEEMPRTLSEFGFFADAAAQAPAEGVVPYRLNTALFSDGAEKLRFLYLPAGMRAAADGGELLHLPVGAALIKTFAFQDSGARRLIETRVMLHRADGWVALPYLWNDEQTEARLALAGARVPVTTPEGRQISYRVPNRNQCKECHGLNGKVVPIGPKARNLSGSWLAAMVEQGRLDRVPQGADILPAWERRDASPVDKVARAYLDVNCAHCHRPGATASNSGLDLRWTQDDPHALGIRKRPVAAGRGAGGHEFDIQPGAPQDSIMTFRMASEEPGIAMPELGKATVDEEGLAAVERWIAGL